MSTRIFILVVLWFGALACGNDERSDAPRDPAAADDAGMAELTMGRVRGRVTDADGQPVASVLVVADDESVRTDESGHFELAVKEGEARVSIEHPEYSSAVLPVRVKGRPASVEVTVLRRKKLKLADAEQGGRVEGADGFAVEVPGKALRRSDGKPVRGEIEVRYVVVNHPKDVTALPGRMEAEDESGLEGFGMSEVRFYQGKERLELSGKARFEIPLEEKHGLGSGKMVPIYGLGTKDRRWKQGAMGKVSGNKVVIESDRGEWLGAAKPLPVNSCVSGRLKISSRSGAANTTIRAARERGLSLIQADTSDDGNFCLPVTPDDEWNVSAYFDDGSGKPRGFAVSLDSSDAVGMCGAEGCKDVGEVELPAL